MTFRTDNRTESFQRKIPKNKRMDNHLQISINFINESTKNFKDWMNSTIPEKYAYGTSGYKNPLWRNKRDQLRIAEDKYKIDNDYVKYHERIVDITEGTKQKIKSKKQKPKNVIP